MNNKATRSIDDNLKTKYGTNKYIVNKSNKKISILGITQPISNSGNKSDNTE